MLDEAGMTPHSSDETDVPVPETGQIGVVLSEGSDGAGRDGLDPGAEPHRSLGIILRAGV